MITQFEDFYAIPGEERYLFNKTLEENRKYSSGEKGYSYPIWEEISPHISYLKLKFIKEMEAMFGDFTISSLYSNTAWCYRSTEDEWASEYHHHKATATINAVWYYQVNPEDSISFFVKEEEHKIFPKQNTLLVFPNFLLHKPNKPTGPLTRYSVNLEIMTEESAQDLWLRVV